MKLLKDIPLIKTGLDKRNNFISSQALNALYEESCWRDSAYHIYFKTANSDYFSSYDRSYIGKIMEFNKSKKYIFGNVELDKRSEMAQVISKYRSNYVFRIIVESLSKFDKRRNFNRLTDMCIRTVLVFPKEEDFLIHDDNPNSSIIL